MTELKIKELRKAAGMTQVNLADAMGVVQSTIASWESGLICPSASKLPILADILHCTIDELYGREAAS